MELKTFEVVVLDIDKINQAVNAFVKEDPKISQEEKDSCTYKIRPSKLCYTLSNKGTIGFFDSELCGNVIGDDGKYPIAIYKVKETEEGKQIGILPEFETAIQATELMTKYCIGTKTIPDFMGTRYNYNNRIIGNQEVFIKFITQE